MRKVSDMALLLGSRGRARPRSSVGKFLRGLSESVFGRSAWRPERPKTMSVPGWAAVAALLVAFAGGFFVRDRFGASPGAKTGLDMREPERAAFVGEAETMRLADEGYVVALYQNIPAADAMAQAKSLAAWLRDQGVLKARSFECQTKVGRLWSVVVWFEGDTEREATRQLLVRLPAVPDAHFEWLRKNTEGWPKAKPIR